MAPLDVKRTADLLTAIKADSDGHLLENLVRMLFEAIPGVEHYAQDVLSGSGNEEIDIAFSNKRDPDGLCHFGSDLLVECKAQARPVSAQDVSWFATKLRRRGQVHGVLIALAGVTGKAAGYPRAGEAEVERCAGEGQQILVLVRDGVLGLQSGEHLAAVLNAKRQGLVAGNRMTVFDAATLKALSPGPALPDSARLLLHPASNVAGEEARAWQLALDAGRVQLRRHIRSVLETIEARRPTELEDVPAGVAGVQQAVPMIRERLETIERWMEELDAAHLAFETPGHDENDLTEALRGTAALVIDLIRLDPASGRLPDLDIICVNVETFAPPRLALHVGSELWKLLTRYYLVAIDPVREQLRAAAIYGLLSLFVTQLMISTSW
jgi:hypothetical protein